MANALGEAGADVAVGGNSRSAVSSAREIEAFGRGAVNLTGDLGDRAVSGPLGRAVTGVANAAATGVREQLTEALAKERAEKGINVNEIAPGYIETDVTTALRADLVRNHQILDRIPAGRWGQPDELAGAVVVLSSP